MSLPFPCRDGTTLSLGNSDAAHRALKYKRRQSRPYIRPDTLCPLTVKRGSLKLQELQRVIRLPPIVATISPGYEIRYNTPDKNRSLCSTTQGFQATG